MNTFKALLFLIMTLFVSCQQKINFDSQLWKESQTEGFAPKPERQEMLEDLLMNHELKGLNTREVIQLLGHPEFHDTLGSPYYLEFMVVQDFGGNIDPVYTKNLYLHLDADKKVKSIEIIEWPEE